MIDINSVLESIIKEPDTSSIIISELINQYKEPMYSIGKEFLLMLKDYSNNEELFDTIAKIKKQQFDSYVKVGFSADQAMAFLINDNLKLMNNMKKTTRTRKTTKTTNIKEE